ncbi:DUF3159 domain-containing protein [Labedella populi]|uniref:DUF3159 domain-containing protein n=1 Tax=Labedella populi TaxID=2498850 RepID=A0A3S3ZRQ6_9MICO|nr:DUF3159 domain-containing protein [Labedella populi]RWZ61435.1 DUF3159 domain-containing protein [Labedella populi]
MTEEGPGPAASPSDDDARKRLQDAARASGIGRLSESESLDGRAVLSAIGGVRGVVEAMLPGLLFLVAFTLTTDLVLSIVVPVAVGALFIAVRALQRQPTAPAIGGLLGIALSAVLALLNNRPEDYYIPGFWTNGAYLVVLLVSVLVGWPIIGVITGLLTGTGSSWRSDTRLRRIYAALTLVWCGLFALRLIVQLPLYYSGAIEALGTTRLVMGIPLYAPVLVLTVLVIRSVIRRSTRPGD